MNMKIPFSRLVVGGLLIATGLYSHRWALAQTAAPQVEAAPSRMSLTLSPVGGVYGMFERPAVGGAPIALQVKASGAVPGVLVTLQARDLWGRETGWRRSVTVQNDAPATVEMPGAIGYYEITASSGEGASAIQAQTQIGIVPPHRAGIRPDSFFASNTSGLKRGDDLRLLQTLSIKVQRAHFNPRIVSVPATPSGVLPLDFSFQDAAFAEATARETWVLPIAGYAFEGTKSKLAIDAEMHGPPRDNSEFGATWERILRRYPQISTVEFWNEPWIFGWTWAGTPQQYRDLQTQWTRMMRRVNPRLRLLAGNSSMFTEDHIEAYPASWRGLIDSTTHHPYSGAGDFSMRSGAQGRTIDHGEIVTRRMGLPFYYLTEGGTEWKDPTAQSLS